MGAVLMAAAVAFRGVLDPLARMRILEPRQVVAATRTSRILGLAPVPTSMLHVLEQLIFAYATRLGDDGGRVVHAASDLSVCQGELHRPLYAFDEVIRSNERKRATRCMIRALDRGRDCGAFGHHSRVRKVFAQLRFGSL
jgi:hypothetical protein